MPKLRRLALAAVASRRQKQRRGEKMNEGSLLDEAMEEELEISRGLMRSKSNGGRMEK